MTTFRLVAGRLVWQVQTWGNPENPPIVLLHGFTWNGASWAEVAERLSDRFYCVAPDLPGHGDTWSPEPVSEWSFTRVVDSLEEALHEVGLTRAHMVGYSMGGRIALQLALRPVFELDGLVLIGTSTGLATVEERKARVQADAELADRLATEGMEAFLERWMALPLFESLRRLDPERLAHLNAGRADQDPIELAAALVTMGTGGQPYLLEALEGLDTPSLLVVGEHDAKFRALNDEMLARLPQGRLEVLPGCGHSVPFERPEELSALISAFIAETPPASSST